MPPKGLIDSAFIAGLEIGNESYDSIQFAKIIKDNGGDYSKSLRLYREWRTKEISKGSTLFISENIIMEALTQDKEWSKLIATMDHFLVFQRQGSFRLCVHATRTNTSFFKFLNKRFKKEIELRFVVYQLNLIKRRIIRLSYIPRVNRDIFLEKMFDYAQKFGHFLERNTYMRKYDFDYSEESEEAVIFWHDVYKYINKEFHLEFEILVASGIVARHDRLLRLGAYLAAAVAFNDKERMKELCPPLGMDPNVMISMMET